MCGNRYRKHLSGDCPFFIPNAFTPNNDSKNDYFGAEWFLLVNFSMKIYNRYGQVVLRRITIQKNGMVNIREKICLTALTW